MRSETGLLSDIEILDRLVADGGECVFVSPLIDPLKQLGPSSLNLHVGTEIGVTRTMNTTHIALQNLVQARHQIDAYTQEHRVEDKFVIHPGEFMLASTLEFIRLPRDIAARLEGRSSLGRLGLQVHATAGFVDPGFSGSLTFELINAGRLPLSIPPGFMLGQLCFFRVHDVQVTYMNKKRSKYSGRLGIGKSMIYLDAE